MVKQLHYKLIFVIIVFVFEPKIVPSTAFMADIVVKDGRFTAVDEKMKDDLWKIIIDHGLSPVTWHFEPGENDGGASVLFIGLYESSLVVDPWPEHGHYQITLHLCDRSRSNAELNKKLGWAVSAYLNADVNLSQFCFVCRGGLGTIPTFQVLSHPDKEDP